MKKVQLLVGTEKGAFILSSDENREHWELSAPIHKGWKVNDLQLDRRTDPRRGGLKGAIEGRRDSNRSRAALRRRP